MTPGLEVEAEAKRFEADPDALTVYVVRSGWGDTRHLVAVSVDDSRPIETVPQSMVRMRLQAGVHRLVFDFEQDHGAIEFTGVLGQVRFIRLAGDFWVWGGSFGWSREDEAITKRRARRTRLVGDLRIL
ncbi:MAG: hypothetical protein Q8R98_28990 [Rubrivivax sp.]|uniref:Uncharacterized protein n=1 Tax=Aquincola tertiaricarbonis TaxID=391953 RepID=A0ABY4S5S6_AQUTE|nr:hypothetical protein [Aquincola tertiaricarbonis]MBQ1763348.1 hypothetical protein [Aquincola sp.]MDO9096227.1 hypothetical protein [Rubrivivax sp.]MDP3615895.1 hypothetical protein [Rubrivivax sp.]URI07794.1 hypothetical protein MW290_04110 [Aquincola tertiaricarbonis]